MNFRKKIGTLSDSYDSAQTGSEEIWRAFSEQKWRLVVGQTRIYVRKIGGGLNVSKVVGKKRCLWKAWKKGAVSKDEYLVAKRASRHVVYAAKKAAEK